MEMLSKTTEDPENPTFGQTLKLNPHKHEHKQESLDSSDCHTKLRKILTIHVCPLQIGL
jgi:hypothetical protein